ncbi:MAG: LysE family transporter, partial [Neisseriaceae bacterium]|nr:LysE family transporter [Neisseriaceae bacterium]
MPMLGLDATHIVAYVTALGLAAAIPGPGMTALIARSISSGATTGLAMLAGLILGDLTYLSLAVFGLALVAHAHTALIVWINWAAAAYLVLLAGQFWRHQPQAISLGLKASPRNLATALLAGLTLTLGNPKTIAFYLAILPLLLPL